MKIPRMQFVFSYSALLRSLPLISAYVKVHDHTFSPDYVLRIEAKNVSFDCQSRYSVVINGSSPGPTIYMREGKTTWVRVYNDMSDQNATVHWHGLSERTAPFSDGTPQVSQWPIPPRNFFDYEVRPDIGDAGSYFYHSHVGFQALSAHGLLIVESCGKPSYDYDDEILLSISDYYNKSDAQVESGLLANPFVWSGETMALLINGQSGKVGFGNASDPSCAPAVIIVKPDTIYRMRFIGSTAISLVTLGIEDHSNFTIIEADGADSKPFTTDHLQVATGQRFSLLFKTKTEEELKDAGKSNFWIRYENRERPANVSGYAILSYDNSSKTLPQSLPDKPPITLPQKVYDWLEYALEPFDASLDPFPTKATRTITINVHQVGVYQGGQFKSTLQWGQNGDVWQEQKVQVPYLVSIYLNGESAIPDYEASLANGGWDPKTLAYPAKIGEVLDIVWESNNFPTGGWEIHPFHAHGKHYWDLGSGNGTYDASENDKKLANYTPIKRDTTMLYRYASSGVSNTTAGWRAWRLKIEDAGAFMIHCHILQHMIMGMSTVWVMGNSTQITQTYPEPYVSGYLEYGGSAYGNESYYPRVNHYYSNDNLGGDGSCHSK